MKLLPKLIDNPLEKAIKKMKSKDFKGAIKKIEKSYGKNKLAEINVKIKFEIKLKNGEKEEEGLRIVEQYKR